MKDNYTVIPQEVHKQVLGSCPLCGSPTEMDEYVDEYGKATKLVCCTNGRPLGLFDDAGREGCPLFLPDGRFYRATYREAAMWHEAFSKSMRELRKGADTLQARGQDWMNETFKAVDGTVIGGKDLPTRCFRFLEEAVELVQSLGVTTAEAHELVDYVFGRPVGHPPQEVGGTMLTLLALCSKADIDCMAEAERELARCWTPEVMNKIRAKQKHKPNRGPLPGSVEEPLEHPAACWVHTTQGLVPACEKHALQLSAIARTMGYAGPAIEILKKSQQLQCTNCINEAKLDDR